jgi:hypothetical protein
VRGPSEASYLGGSRRNATRIATQLALPYTVRRTEDRRAVKPDEKEAQRQRGDRYSAIGPASLKKSIN